MLPKIFSNNFQDPMSAITISPNIREIYRSPLLTSLKYQNMYYDRNVEIEVTTMHPLGEDVIYALPVLPALREITELEYTIRVPYTMPECYDTYIRGVFRNSMEQNLSKFGKYEMLYMPCAFAEQFNGAELGYNDLATVGTFGRITFQPVHRGPAEIRGKLFLFNNVRMLPQKTMNKQKHRAFRICIFK